MTVSKYCAYIYNQELVMNAICETCATDPSAHSFKKVAEKKGIVVFYSKPTQAKRYDDSEGILAHIDKTMALYQGKKWICIIDCEGFDAKYTMEIRTGMGIMDLLMNKYVDTLVEVKVINPTIYVRAVMKVLMSLVSDDKTSKIIVLDDKPYSVLQFI
jgi:hypothetical protein